MGRTEDIEDLAREIRDACPGMGQMTARAAAIRAIQYLANKSALSGIPIDQVATVVAGAIKPELARAVQSLRRIAMGRVHCSDPKGEATAALQEMGLKAGEEV